MLGGALEEVKGRIEDGIFEAETEDFETQEAIAELARQLEFAFFLVRDGGYVLGNELSQVSNSGELLLKVSKYIFNNTTHFSFEDEDQKKV